MKEGNVRSINNHGSCSYNNVDRCDERLKRLFNQALLTFLEEEEEECNNNNKRHLPAIICDGETVDLFKLFMSVKERGGFDSVSSKGLWESVAEKLGFDSSVIPSLRLVYCKYLDRIEKWSAGKSKRELEFGFKGKCKKRKRNHLSSPDCEAEFPRRYVSIGSHFQANVDEWKESGLVSDKKWVGTVIWPLEGLDRTVGIGQGRQDCCGCDNIGSIECVRFHIAEKRMKLKRDLGDVYFHWRFDQMGEEVSLRWTEREHKRFKEMMIWNPEWFWEKAVKCFRGKKREEIVSYYFNVFLINRRRYQNRVTPRDVDSDDDERAFGSVGTSFGRDVVASFGSDFMICSQNRQCNDFE